MKTYFSVAALVGLAAAGYGGQNPYWNGGGGDSLPNPDPEDPRPDECEQEVNDLEKQLNDIEDICDGQKQALAGLDAMCSAMGTTINSLVTSTDDNQTTIAYCVENNKQQAATITQLGERLNKLDVDLNGDGAQGIQGLISCLEDLKAMISDMTGITADIEAADMKMQQIKAQVDNNTNVIGILNGDASTEGSINQLAASNTIVEGRITDINIDIGTQTTIVNQQNTSNMMNETLLMDLEADILPGVVLTDYFFVNSQQISFLALEDLVPDTSSFCVPVGVPFEVYATMSSTGVTNAYVHDLSIREVLNTSVILAQSSAPSGIQGNVIPRDRDMTVLYKGLGTGQDLGIFYQAIQSTENAVTPALNLQVGVKVYTDNYPLNESQQLVCPPT